MSAVITVTAKAKAKIQAKARAKAQEQTKARAKAKAQAEAVMWLYGHNMTKKENWNIFICIYSQEITRIYLQNSEEIKKHTGGRSERLQSNKDKPPFVNTIKK